ncbi:hypothetical protein JW978_03410 [Candidatus Dojkabacteria bacterium]|nr:hypothetical protein [Candidatus Dojkabacteria bacterium]
MQAIPSKFHNLFWDVGIDGLSLEKHKNFITCRILEKGSFDSIKWLLQTYKLHEVSDIITHSSNLTTSTISFWKQILKF